MTKTLNGVEYKFISTDNSDCCSGCVFKDGQVRGCPDIGNLCTKEKGVWVRSDSKVAVVDEFFPKNI